MYETLYTWGQFAPSFGLVILAVLILMADTFLPKFARKNYALIGGVGAFIAACYQMGGAYDSPFGMIASMACALCLFMSYDYDKVSCVSVNGGQNDEGTGEFYALPLIATAGICAMCQARDLIMLFVCMEVLTLSSYVLTGYYRRNQGSIEAGVKYLIVGALSTGILVFGAAWYYGSFGSFELSPVLYQDALFGAHAPFMSTSLLVALGLLMVGILFKVGAAPMHMWVPDVYQGAPTPVSAFLAVASKTAGIVALFIVLMPILGVNENIALQEAREGNIEFTKYMNLVVGSVTAMLSVIIALTLLIGNIGAMAQRNAKRLLGYSSIGQAGFLLVFFLDDSGSGAFIYLVAYGLACVGAFTAIALVRMQRGSEQIEAFRGLGRSNPRTAFLITVCLASMAGVPLTLGFIGKYQAFVSLIAATDTYRALYYLLPIMVLAAGAGFYYYFKIMRAMYWDKAEEGQKPLQLPLVSGLILAVCSITLIIVGTLPLLKSDMM